MLTWLNSPPQNSHVCSGVCCVESDGYVVLYLKKMQIPNYVIFLYLAGIIPSHLALSLTGYLLLHCAADIKLLSVYTPQIQALLCVRKMLETITQLETPGVILLSFLYADSVTDQ